MSRSKRTVSVTAKAEQANEHDDEQEDSRNKAENCWRFGNLDIEWLAWGAGSFPSIAELPEGLE
jgi:hypothetical protein